MKKISYHGTNAQIRAVPKKEQSDRSLMLRLFYKRVLHRIDHAPFWVRAL